MTNDKLLEELKKEIRELKEEVRQARPIQYVPQPYYVQPWYPAPYQYPRPCWVWGNQIPMTAPTYTCTAGNINTTTGTATTTYQL